MAYHPYTANPRLYGKRHLEKDSWNQGRLQGHLREVHEKNPDTRTMKPYFGSYKRDLVQVHNTAHGEPERNEYKKGEKNAA